MPGNGWQKHVMELDLLSYLLLVPFNSRMLVVFQYGLKTQKLLPGEAL
jgi:hypothetical protein